ncbi:MAG TPA: response regulator [Thermoanaerobaculia bacterium]|nr:response regulator [Thermoanaerobaculia bacterium]
MTENRDPDRRRALRALIVEDDLTIHNLVKVVLEREGFIVEGVRNGKHAIELLGVVAYDLVILDLLMPLVGGEVVLGFISNNRPSSLRRVIVTTASPAHLSCDFLQGVCHILEKPFDIDRLIVIARECADFDAA